jgi:hypothetical protein
MIILSIIHNIYKIYIFTTIQYNNVTYFPTLNTNGGPAAIINFRSVLLSERAPHINKPETVKNKIIKERRGKIDRVS